MNRPVAIKTRLFACLLSALAAMTTGRVVAQEQRSQSSDSSVIRSGYGATNADDSASKEIRDELIKERLRDRILKPFRQAQDSFDGTTTLFVPQQRSFTPAEIRRLKERIQEHRAWLYGESAAAAFDHSGENPFEATNLDGYETGQDTLSVLKRQYRDLDGKKMSFTNAPGRDHPTSDDPDQDRDSLADDYGRRKDKKSEQDSSVNDVTRMKAIFDSSVSKVSGLAMPNNIFSDLFGGQSSATMPAADNRIDEQRTSDFRKLLNSGPASSAARASALNSLGGSPQVSSSATTVGGGLADSRAMPAMATMPGYDAASSLAPAFSSPASAIAPLAIPQPEPVRPTHFNQDFGPPRRLF